MRTLIALAGAAAVLLAAQPSSAQGPFRQEVVVTAAATPVELGTVTRTLTVITRDQIARLPVHSIADVLRLTAAVASAAITTAKCVQHCRIDSRSS